MDFEPSPEQRRLTELATSFATGIAASLPKDATGFATEAYAALGARGHFAVRTVLDASLVVVSLSRVSTGLGATFASGWLFLDALRRHGQGATLGAVAAGAEAGTRTGSVVLASSATEVAVSEDGGQLVLSGTTSPVPLGPLASDALVAAALADGTPVLACVDLSSGGVRKATPSPSLGLEQVPRGALELGVARVPAERVLATGAKATTAMRSLGSTRSVLWAAVAVGVAGRALDMALAHVRARSKMPQSTEFVVSDLATGYDAAYLATMNAAWLCAQSDGSAAGAAGAAAKLLATRTATEVCHGALTVVGETGYEDELRRAYVDARHLELYDGAEAEQIDVIASHMLGES
ncbi:MAG TPA: acyl-CoA dehydrogenase family protein [Polyangiaceae bacterium]|jgi:alkylation response protein AidB-like acyl-CoA dehydrogenase|nr:acyl-CoA dehydrogenase family protein [Polyangiaceae bacterium]